MSPYFGENSMRRGITNPLLFFIISSYFEFSAFLLSPTCGSFGFAICPSSVPLPPLEKCEL